MTDTDEITITVADEADVILAGRQAKAVLADLAFDESALEELVLVVHELASNIVKHAGEGSITLTPQSRNGRGGVEIHAHDSGPGIADVGQAVVDGYSTVGSLGGGLGAVHRLMDEVVVNSGADATAGVRIVATRWNGAAPSDQRAPPLAVGAATRAKPGHDHNGDAFLIEHGRGQTLVGVIDGLGHGQAAHRASRTAQRYVRRHSTQPLADLFSGVERDCRGTRGVVMLLARFDWDADNVTLGGVGNITVRLCHSPEPRHLVSTRGVLGGNAPSPTITEWSWSAASVLVVHSDGLTSRWRCDEVSLRDGRSATTTADDLLQSLWTREDDATVLVVRGVDR